MNVEVSSVVSPAEAFIKSTLRGICPIMFFIVEDASKVLASPANPSRGIIERGRSEDKAGDPEGFWTH